MTDIKFPLDFNTMSSFILHTTDQERGCNHGISIHIGQVSKAYGISARMLRYYEQIGLLESLRKEDNELMNSGASSTEAFEEELKADGRLDILNKYRKPGAPLLSFASIDLDSHLQGGWRSTICLAESDVTDAHALMEHNPYVGCIDASKWLLFEYAGGDDFDDHAACRKLDTRGTAPSPGHFPK